MFFFLHFSSQLSVLPQGFEMGQQLIKWQNCLSPVAYVPLSVTWILNPLQGLCLWLGSSIPFWLLRQEPTRPGGARMSEAAVGCTALQKSLEVTKLLPVAVGNCRWVPCSCDYKPFAALCWWLLVLRGLLRSGLLGR